MINLKEYKTALWFSILCAISGTILGAVSTIFVTFYLGKYNDAQVSFNKLETEIRTLSFKDERIFLFCKNNYKLKPKKLNMLADTPYTREIDTLNTERDKNLDTLIDVTKYMSRKKMLGEKSYNVIKEFTFWNSKMYGLGRSDAVCKMQLKNQEELIKWREEIIFKISEYENR